MTAAPQTPAPPHDADPIIGIDLGTTNSLVAWCDASGPRILPDEEGRHLLPSVVRFDPDSGAPVALGYEARAHAVEFPQATVFSIKRLMGRGLRDAAGELPYLPYEVVAGAQDTARVRIGRHILSPQEISAVLLRELRRRAELFFRRPVRKAVITVPAYFDDAQRQATRDAGRIAGLEVVRIVNEPTASSLAYHLGQRHADTTIAVYDLGGGTFDVSILRLQHAGTSDESAAIPGGGATPRGGGTSGGGGGGGAVDQVLATHGDTHLGGDDVDQMIVALIQTEVRAQFGADLEFPPATRQAFRTLAEAAKVRLSDQPAADIEVDLGSGRVYRRRLTREELDRLLEPWVGRTIACCAQALRDAQLPPAAIERVVLVGGCSRIPLVRRRVAEFFGSEPYTALNPDEVVALGAAVQGAILAGIHRDLLLLDVIPLSLGIETLGGAVAKLIMANSTIPARATERFTTYVDGQTNVKVHVLQGERELVADCRSLAQFDLRGIPPMPAGLPKIEVTFLIDANGILSVSAVEQRSLQAASIQIVPNHGLTRAEVAAMESAAFTHARTDMAAHRLIDLRNQARMDLRHIERQLDRVGSDLDPHARAVIDQKMTLIRTFLAAPDSAPPDPDAFHRALTDMDHATLHLAELAIRKTLTQEGLTDP
jgi:molecular chaperone DnaK (HSP70)